MPIVDISDTQNEDWLRSIKKQTSEEKKPIAEPAEDKPHAVITVATPGKPESE